MTLRTYANFLLFEGMLENMPATSPPMTSAVISVVNPTVPIIEADCGTLLGEVVPLSPISEGLVETATGVPLTETRINYLFSQNLYSVGVRTAASCTSTGGVCQKCYSGTFPDRPLPETGSFINIPPRYIMSTDEIAGNGTTVTFPLLNDTSIYPLTLVFSNGEIVSQSLYTLSGPSIIFTTPPALNIHYIVKNYGPSTDGFLGFLARSYSGALFGIKELPTYRLPLPHNLYENLLITDSMLNSLFKILVSVNPPSSTMEFYGRITSRLEKALFIFYNYIIYSSITQ